MYIAPYGTGDSNDLRTLKIISCVCLLGICLSLTALGREAKDYRITTASANVPVIPAYRVAKYDVGEIALAVQNNGTFGLFRGNYTGDFRDTFTGESIRRGCEYPQWSQLEHINFTGLWVGAI